MIKLPKSTFRSAFFALLSAVALQAQGVLHMDFIRHTWEDGKADSVKGELWQYPPRHIALVVSHPLQQWMLLDSNKMLLYYPADKKAFRFSSKREFSMPFFQAFVSAKEGKAVLSNMGFTLKQNLEKGDTLFSFWDPPLKSRKAIGIAKVGIVKSMLVVSEVDDPKGNLMVKSFFRNYQKKGNVLFPMEIEIQSQAKHHSLLEKDFFTNLNPQATLPADIRDFQIPSGAQVKDIEW